MICATKFIWDRILILMLGLASVMITAHGEEISSYKIELILFTHRSETATQSIHSSDITEWPDIENAVELSVDQPNVDQTDGLFRALPLSETNLAEEISSLVQSKRYEVIKHLIWQQPGFGHASARSVHIHGGKDFKDQFPERLNIAWNLYENDQLVRRPTQLGLEQVDGTVKVVLGRYLHVYTDLIFREPIMGEIEQSDGQVRHTTYLADYRIRTHRRMRSQELHYLDHPLLGILVEITPISEPENLTRPSVE